ncbi:hypothetical protein GIB67_011074 [Kingdonia uniflora]|uniref:Uncharacterized protein n=1 Tax=Kingdonia uniflora TaxID=39325 RepID=A0A7J7L6N0_9MAGN|nr:hypothetical protein GIB67_011074 [Kingdonia uniflora]
MNKLSRKWRKNRREGDDDHPIYDDTTDPIDTQEQEELIRSFELKQAQESLLWRRIFAALVLCFVAFLLFSMLHQTSSPWELRYHAYFMEEVNSWALIFAEALSILACFMAIKGLFHKSKDDRKWMWYSCYVGLLLAAFWLFYMLRLAEFRWEIIWLPFGPLSVALLCLYVDYLLAESSDEIRKLRGYMYAYKAA